MLRQIVCQRCNVPLVLVCRATGVLDFPARFAPHYCESAKKHTGKTKKAARKQKRLDLNQGQSYVPQYLRLYQEQMQEQEQG